LVEDLDLILISPNGEESKPLVLDPANPTKEAEPGEDHLNNIEQITIKNPEPGNYTIVVRATNLIYAESKYTITWNAPQSEVVLTCPFGGESIIPNQSTYIAWSATTGDKGNWMVEYSSNGEEWALIAENIPGEDRSITWAAPGNISQLEIRVSNEEAQVSDVTNEPVSVVVPPHNLTSTELCATTLQLSWNEVNGAKSYGVYKFDNEEL